MKVAILIADGGDGSACLRWFKDVKLAEALSEADDWCEEFGYNDNGPEVIEVSDDFVAPGGFDDCHYREELDK